MYFDCEVVIDGKMSEIRSMISENYSVGKPWANIRDVCWDEPIRNDTAIRTYPWVDDSKDLETDNDLKQAFKELKDKECKMARFSVTPYIGLKPKVPYSNGQSTI